MAKRNVLQLPVVSAGAEYLVMGYLMRRNILTYKAPPMNKGYDLVCVHPPSHKPKGKRLRQVVKVQVKSRYATDANQKFLIKESSLDACDFVIVVFQNIGYFKHGRNGGQGGEEKVLFYTIPPKIIRSRLEGNGAWETANISGIGKKYQDEAGFELIAKALGVERPLRRRMAQELVGE